MTKITNTEPTLLDVYQEIAMLRGMVQAAISAAPPANTSPGQ